MKLVSFLKDGQAQAGFEIGETIHCLAGSGVPTTMRDYIQGGSAVWQTAADKLKAGQLATVPVSGTVRLAPLPNPGKIVAIGLNYMDHCREQNVKPPAAPLVFAKFPSAVIGPGEVISWDPALTSQVDYEVELAVVIGRRARHVSEEAALDFVFGYTIINDISARDLQFSDVQWVRAKSLDTFCPMGPAIVTADEIPDPQALALRCVVDGVSLQDSSTREMIFGVRYLISYLSRSFTLEPGDVISTGTPNGVGVFRNPKVFLHNGSVVHSEVERIGAFENVAREVSGG